MQAIQTKFIPATNTKPSRIKATCERGSIIISADSANTWELAHREAVKALVQKFAKEDGDRYGSPVKTNPWLRPFITGGLPDGSYAHVFVATK